MTKKMKDTFLFQLPFNFYDIDFIEIEILLKLIWRVNLAIYWCPTYIPWQEYSNGNNDQIYFQCTQLQLV